MKKLIVLRGVMGAGKTHFATHFAKDNDYELIDYDGLFRLHNKDYQITLKKFIELVNASNKDVFCDGWFSPHYLKEVKNRTLEKWLVYASPEVCYRRFCERVKLKNPKDYNVDIIIPIYSKIFLIKDYDKIIDYTKEYDGKTKPEEVTREEMDRRYDAFIKKRNECIELADYIKNNFSYYYQGYKFDCGVETLGLRGKNGEFLTDISFNELLKYIDFKGKSVLDLGTNVGYFCFKAKENGATTVTGIENSDRYLLIANKIKKVLGYDVNFVKKDIVEMDYPESDIILLLSIVHHFETPFYVLKKAFKKCNTLVVELDLPRNKDSEIEISDYVENRRLFRISVGAMNKYADSQGFKLANQFGSEKLARTFMVYRRKK